MNDSSSEAFYWQYIVTRVIVMLLQKQQRQRQQWRHEQRGRGGDAGNETGTRKTSSPAKQCAREVKLSDCVISAADVSRSFSNIRMCTELIFFLCDVDRIKIRKKLFEILSIRSPLHSPSRSFVLRGWWPYLTRNRFSYDPKTRHDLTRSDCCVLCFCCDTE